MYQPAHGKGKGLRSAEVDVVSQRIVIVPSDYDRVCVHFLLMRESERADTCAPRVLMLPSLLLRLLELPVLLMPTG